MQAFLSKYPGSKLKFIEDIPAVPRKGDWLTLDDETYIVDNIIWKISEYPYVIIELRKLA